MEGVKKMIELDRQYFLVLYRDEVISNHYIILNDNYFNRDFCAKNDTEALQYFKSLV